MAKKKSPYQSSSNFRQQESTARKTENNIHTEAQKQFTQTATLIKNEAPKREAKLQKKFTDQAPSVFHKQESTVSKIENSLNTAEQHQINQTSSVVSNSFSSNQSKLQKQFSQTESQSSNLSGSANKSKLQKKFADQSPVAFHKQESTVNKIEGSLNTAEQQQINQTTSVISNSFSSNQSKLQKQFSQTESQSSNLSGSANKSKLQKKFSDQTTARFHKQESAASKTDKVIKTEDQQQLARSEKAVSHTTNSSKINRLQNPKSNKQRFKLKTKDYAKGTLVIAGNSLKNGAKKYQKELEKGDAEGVTITSKSATATIKTIKLSTKTIQKLKERRLESKNFKKAKENPLHKAKSKESSLKKISAIPATALKSGAKKYQKELEKGDAEGVKLVSQSATQIAKASKKLSKGISKINAQSGKLNKPNTKLIQLDFNKNKKLKKESKAILKKKAYKKKLYYAPKKGKAAYTGVLSSFSNRIKDIVSSLGNINLANVKRLIGAKLATAAGSGLITILPFILAAAIILVLVGVLGGQSQQQIIGTKNLSPEVEQWRSLVEAEAAAQGMEAYVGLLLAIIQVETGGTGTRDIMQSSESAGYPVNYWSTEELSVQQGIKHLKSIVNMVKPFGLENDYKLLAQAYNFGSYFAKYVTNLGGIFNLDIAEKYSREVVAPSLGNYTGQTYSYVNSTSERLGKTYLYRNGGNFMYAELVSEYLGGGAGITGDFAIVVAELEKYLGWAYQWGGKSPSTGFDCSGFVSWGLKQIGIDLPSYAASQYDLTVPIDPSEAQPGDLIFFKGTYGGPNHVSHVGFYIDENTMLDSNGSGVGYHNWKSSYWQSHYAGIHRVVR